MKARTRKIFLTVLSVIVAALLAVGICFAVTSTGDRTFSADTDTHTAETLASHSSHDGWTGISAYASTISSGNYCISQNRTATITISSGSNVTFCLSGYTLSAYNSIAIYMESNSTLEICDCKSNPGRIRDGTGYSSKLWGGAIYMESGCTLTISNGTIRGNSANLGGAIYAEKNSTINMTGGAIYDNDTWSTSNNSYGSGSAIYMDSGSTFNMSGGEIYGNRAASNASQSINAGGTVYVNGTVNMSGGSIHDNEVSPYGSYGGGAIVSYNNGMTMSGGEIYNNSARIGGGLFVTQADFTMTGGKIYDNTAVGGVANAEGGGIYILSSNGQTIKISGGEIYGNNASYGGAIYYKGMGDITLSGGNIYDNYASKDGGGIYFYGSSSSGSAYVTMSGMSVTGNVADGYGGGMVLRKATSFDMKSGDISKNTAGTYGGGVYVYADSTFSGGTISGNTAGTSGGGMYVVAKYTATLSGVTISENYAQDGGGIYVCDSGAVNFSSGSISSNIAYCDGGGVYTLGAFNMSGGEIYGNTAGQDYTSYGGGVCVGKNGTLTMTAGTVSENHTDGLGGGISTSGGTETEITITGGTITENTAMRVGGVYSDNSVSISGEVIISGNCDEYNDGNAATDGAIYPSDLLSLASYPVTLTGALSSGSSIGINFMDGSATTQTQITESEGTTSYYKTAYRYFFLDYPVDGMAIYYDTDDKCVCLVSPEDAVAKFDNGSYDVYFFALADALETSTTSSEDGGMLTILADVTLESTYTVSSGCYLSIDLNGHTISMTDNTYLKVNGTLSMYDSTGVYISQGDDGWNASWTEAGAAVYDNGDGTFTTVYSTTDPDTGVVSYGAYTSGALTGRTTTSNSNIYLTPSGSTPRFYMYGGSIVNNTNNKGAVYIGGSSSSGSYQGEFYMYGGSISGNSATYGGAVYVENYSKAYMYGGIISGNTATRGAFVDISSGYLYLGGGTDDAVAGIGLIISDNVAAAKTNTSVSVYYGGAVDVDSGTLYMYDGVEISSNVGQYGAGIVVMGGGKAYIYGGLVLNNVAMDSSYGGGGIYVSTETHLYGLSAGGSGGLVVKYNTCNGNTSNITVVNASNFYVDADFVGDVGINAAMSGSYTRISTQNDYTVAQMRYGYMWSDDGYCLGTDGTYLYLYEAHEISDTSYVIVYDTESQKYVVYSYCSHCGQNEKLEEETEVSFKVGDDGKTYAYVEDSDVNPKDVEVDTGCAVTGSDGSVTWYPDMESALESISSGETVTLLGDLEEESLTIDVSGVTIDLNGHTLTGDITVDEGVSLTVTDSGEGTGVLDGDITLSFGSSLDITGGTFTGTIDDGDGTFTVTGGTFSQDVTENIVTGSGLALYVTEDDEGEKVYTVISEDDIPSGYGAVVTYTDEEGNTVNVYYENAADALRDAAKNAADYEKTSITLYEDVTSEEISFDGGNITIDLNGCELDGDISLESGTSLTVCDTGAEGSGSVTGDITLGDGSSLGVSGGTFTGTIDEAEGTFTVTGGTFSQDVTENIVTGSGLALYVTEDDEGEKVYTVISEDDIPSGYGAVVTYTDEEGNTVNVYYENAADAFEDIAANAGDYESVEVTLYEDTTLENFSFVDGNITIDLNGYDLTVTYGVTVGDDDANTGASLTITDSSEDKGTFTGDVEVVGTFGEPVDAKENSFTIDGANMDGDITAGDNTSVSVEDSTVSGSVSAGENSVVTIDGSKIGSDEDGLSVLVGEGSTLNISGSVVEGDIDLGNGSTASIDGGTYEGDITLGEGSSLAVSGGTFTGTIDESEGTLTVTGGTFTQDISENISEGMGLVEFVSACDDEGNCTYTVVSEEDAKNNAAASVTYTTSDGSETTIYFESVEDAVKAAVEAAASQSDNESVMVTLYDDVEEDTSLDFESGDITLDLNGFEVNGSITVGTEEEGSSATLTITDSSLDKSGAVNGSIDIVDNSENNDGEISNNLIIEGGTYSATTFEEGVSAADYMPEDGTEYVSVNNEDGSVTIVDKENVFDFTAATVEITGEDGEVETLYFSSVSLALEYAATSGGKVTLYDDADLYESEVIYVTAGMEIDLNGHTLENISLVIYADGTDEEENNIPGAGGSLTVTDSSEGEGVIEGTIYVIGSSSDEVKQGGDDNSYESTLVFDNVTPGANLTVDLTYLVSTVSGGQTEAVDYSFGIVSVDEDTGDVTYGIVTSHEHIYSIESWTRNEDGTITLVFYCACGIAETDENGDTVSFTASVVGTASGDNGTVTYTENEDGTVTIKAEITLSDSDGHEGTYTYEETITPVVAVTDASGNTTYFDSLEDAVAFANQTPSSTLTLLSDVEEGEDILVTGDFTLDLNGFDFAGDITVGTTDEDSSASLTIKDTSEDHSGTVTGQIEVADNSENTGEEETANKLVITGGTYSDGTFGGASVYDYLPKYDEESDENVAAVWNSDGSVSVVPESEAISSAVATIETDGNIYYFTSLEDAVTFAETLESATITIINSVGSEEGAEEINITSGSITIDLNGQTVYADITIESGTLELTDSGEENTGTLYGSLTGEITVSGGQYSQNISDLLSDEEALAVVASRDDEGNLLYKVVSAEDLESYDLAAYVETEDGTRVYYESIADAFDDAQDGSTITLLGDVTDDEMVDSLIVSDNRDITLDLNGYDFAEDITVETGSSLTIVDGTGNEETEGTGTFSGDITVVGGSLDMDIDGDITGDITVENGGSASVKTEGSFTGDISVIGENSTLEAEIEGDFTGDIAVDAGTASVEVGGDITTTEAGISVENDGSLVINAGGDIDASNGGITVGSGDDDNTPDSSSLIISAGSEDNETSGNISGDITIQNGGSAEIDMSGDYTGDVEVEDGSLDMDVEGSFTGNISIEGENSTFEAEIEGDFTGDIDVDAGSASVEVGGDITTTQDGISVENDGSLVINAGGDIDASQGGITVGEDGTLEAKIEGDFTGDIAVDAGTASVEVGGDITTTQDGISVENDGSLVINAGGDIDASNGGITVGSGEDEDNPDNSSLVISAGSDEENTGNITGDITVQNGASADIDISGDFEGNVEVESGYLDMDVEGSFEGNISVEGENSTLEAEIEGDFTGDIDVNAGSASVEVGGDITTTDTGISVENDGSLVINAGGDIDASNGGITVGENGEFEAEIEGDFTGDIDVNAGSASVEVGGDITTTDTGISVENDGSLVINAGGNIDASNGGITVGSDDEDPDNSSLEISAGSDEENTGNITGDMSVSNGAGADIDITGDYTGDVEVENGSLDMDVGGDFEGDISVGEDGTLEAKIEGDFSGDIDVDAGSASIEVGGDITTTDTGISVENEGSLVINAGGDIDASIGGITVGSEDETNTDNSSLVIGAGSDGDETSGNITGDITVQNGASADIDITGDYTGDVEVENGSFEMNVGGDFTGDISVGEDSEFEAEIEGDFTGDIDVDAGSASVEVGGDITTTQDGISVENDGSLVINAGGDIDASNGGITVGSEEETEGSSLEIGADGNITGDLTVEDGADLIIGGGTYSDDISAFVEDGKVAYVEASTDESEDEDTKYIIVDEEYATENSAAYIESADGSRTYYEDIEDAAASLKDGDTLVLLQDVDEGTSIAVLDDVEATLDLNGYEVMGDITVGTEDGTGSTLTIIDTSEDMSGAVNGSIEVADNSSKPGTEEITNKVIIEGGTYSDGVFGEDASAGDFAGENSIVVDNGDGTSTIIDSDDIDDFVAAYVEDAEGNKTYYSSFEAALEAVKENGGTIVLNSDVDAGELIISENITIDLNGHTLTADIEIVADTDDGAGLGGSLTVKDSSEDNSGEIIGTISVTGEGSFDHDGGSNPYENTLVFNGGAQPSENTEIDLSSLTGDSYLFGKISEDDDEGVTYGIVSADGHVHDYEIEVWTRNADGTVTLTLMCACGEYETDSVTGEELVYTADDVTVTVNGDGTVSYKATVTDGNGNAHYYEETIEYVATVTIPGGNGDEDSVLYFETLQDAIEYAEENGYTIKLEADSDEDIYVGSDVTIDTNGYELGGSAEIEDGATLTIIGDGTIDIDITVTGDGDMAIQSGTFGDSDYAQYVDEGYAAVGKTDTEGNMTYEVVPEEEAVTSAAAEIVSKDGSSVYYESLDDALADLSDGDTLVLLQDVEEGTDFEITVNDVTLDLNNHSVNATVEVAGGASLTVTGEGYVEDVDATEGGELILESGTYGENVAQFVAEGTYTYGYTDDEGSLVYDVISSDDLEEAGISASVTVTGEDGKAYTAYFETVQDAIDYAETFGGTVTLLPGEDGVIYESLTIDGEVVIDLNGVELVGDITVNDTSSLTIVDSSATDTYPGDGMIDGIFFTGDDIEIEIFAGTYSDENVKGYVGTDEDNTYVVVMNGDGTYTVTTEEIAMSLSGAYVENEDGTKTYFVSFEDAAEYASETGGKITLTSDVTAENKIVITDDIVIDLNGHTLTADIEIIADSDEGAGYGGSLTVTDSSDNAGSLAGSISVTGEGSADGDNPYGSTLVFTDGVTPSGDLDIDLSGLTGDNYCFSSTDDGYGITPDDSHTHVFDIPVWTFNGDGTVTLTFMCACGETDDSISYTAAVEATLNGDGSLTYTAEITVDGNIYAYESTIYPAVQVVLEDGTELYFDSLQEAIASVGDGSATITLLKDVDEEISVSSGDITIDLGGHELTGGITVDENASLTMYGEGTIEGIFDFSGDVAINATGDGIEIILDGDMTVSEGSELSLSGDIAIDLGSYTLEGAISDGGDGTITVTGESGSKIALKGDLGDGRLTIVADGDITIDLGGYVLDADIVITEGSSLKIYDMSGTNEGYVSGTVTAGTGSALEMYDSSYDGLGDTLTVVITDENTLFESAYTDEGELYYRTAERDSHIHGYDILVSYEFNASTSTLTATYICACGEEVTYEFVLTEDDYEISISGDTVTVTYGKEFTAVSDSGVLYTDTMSGTVVLPMYTEGESDDNYTYSVVTEAGCSNTGVDSYTYGESGVVITVETPVTHQHMTEHTVTLEDGTTFTYCECEDCGYFYFDENGEDGYESAEDIIEDKGLMDSFEEEKGSALEDIEGSVPDGMEDNEDIQDVIDKAKSDLDELEYDPQTGTSEERQQYAEDLSGAIGDIVDEAQFGIDRAQQKATAEEEIREAIGEKIESGIYSDEAVQELEEMMDMFIDGLDGVSANVGDDLETIFGEYLEKVFSRIADVKITVLYETSADADDTGASSVTNAEGMASSVEFVIEDSDTFGIGSFDSYTLVSVGGSMTESEMTALLSGKEVLAVYDIYLRDSVTKITVNVFSGEYTIRLLLPEDLRGNDDLVIVYIGNDGVIEVFDAVRDGDYMIFTTTHFSQFVILGIEETSYAYLTIIFMILLVLLLIILIAAIVSLSSLGGKAAKGVGTTLAVVLGIAAIAAVVILGLLFVDSLWFAIAYMALCLAVLLLDIVLGTVYTDNRANKGDMAVNEYLREIAEEPGDGE